MHVNEETLEALREPELVEVREEHFERLERLFSGDIRGQPLFLSGITAISTASPPGWEEWLPDLLDHLARQAGAAADRRVFRPLLLCWDPHGVHFVDELFGASVMELETGWQAVPLEAKVGTLEAPDLEECATWCEIRGFTRCFLELDLDAVTLVLPTISSPLNIAVNLYGDRILQAMLLDPDAARHDLRVIAVVLCAIHRWYLDNVPAERMQCIAAAGRTQPRGHGQICGCSTHLVSGPLYEEFIADLDARVLDVYPQGGLIHLCGSHAQHTAVWRGMASVRAVQTNDRATEDVGAFYGGLREDQILYAHPCHEMPADEILAATQGGDRTVLCAEPKAVAHLL